MQEYNVVLSETAENDLDDVVEYLSNFSKGVHSIAVINLDEPSPCVPGSWKFLLTFASLYCLMQLIEYAINR